MQLKLDKTIKLDRDAIMSPNLAMRFGDADLSRIAEVCLEGYEKDRQSRKVWLRRTEAAMDLAMQVSEEKSFPWPNASNVIFPLVTIAALQFHARAYPEIVQGTDVVKCRVPGYAEPPEVDVCERIGKFMSYQLLEEDQSWEEQHDRLLLNLAIVGCAFKKSYYDPTLRSNASQLVRARDLVVDYFAKSIDTARRKTQVCPVYRNEIWERAAIGIYRDVRKEPWFTEDAQYLPDAEEEEAADSRAGLAKPSGDHAAPFRCLEQHTWLDLDGDGYDEPYIVLIEEGSGSVLRIVSRCDRVEDVVRDGKGKVVGITAGEFFTKYGFIPSPDGGIYDVGFGVLLGPLNESVNSLINQLVDAGTMANTAGGFLGRGAKIRGGVYTFAPMEWKRVDSTGDDLKKSIFPLPVREPSNVLFQLLSLLINYTQRVSGSTETLAGENPGQNTKVGTVDTLVEQGLKIYGAIFKRVWRSMKQEFQKLYALNAIHLPNLPMRRGGVMISRGDFDYDAKAIVPVADPNVVSDRIRVQQALTVAERAAAIPGYDMPTVEKNLLKALQIEAPERFYVGVEKTGTPQDPKLALEQEKTKREGMKLRLQAQMFSLEIEEQHWVNSATIQQLEAQSTKLLAEAKGTNVELQIQAINSAVGALRSHNEQLHARAQLILQATNREDGGDQSRHIQHLVTGPGDPSIPPAPPIPAGAGEGAVG